MVYDKNNALISTSIPGLAPPQQGKVRDVYAIENKLLLVATDRISAFDVVMPNGIPEKGRILTAISNFWFELLAEIPNHVVSSDVDEYPAVLQPVKEHLRGRSMLVEKLEIIPFECIVRGYLTGSGWAEYAETGGVNSQPLRSGYQNGSKLDTPLFTPSTKAEQGEHDQAISLEAMQKCVGKELTDQLAALSINCYQRAADYAAQHGIIIADTKFEFGENQSNTIILADEVLTPDSSRFWPEKSYTVGKNPPSLDKQYLRDWLVGINFNKEPPAPELPDEVVFNTRAKYIEAYEQLVGKTWIGGGREVISKR